MAENDLKLIQEVGGGVPRQRTIATLNAITDAASFKTALSIGSGTGDVTSVNGVTPVAGDVTLTPADIGAVDAASAGTIITLDAPDVQDLAAVTEPLRTGEPFKYNYYKVLSGDLTLTDPAVAPTEGHGYRLTLIGDSTDRLITIPSSISEAQGGGITFFYVRANSSITIKRQYVNGAWRIWGDPAPGTAGVSAQVKVLQGLGSSIIAQTMNIEAATTTSAFGDGSLSLVAVYIPTVSTVTGVRWFQTVEGNVVFNNNNKVALYSYAAGNLTLVASSANSALCWDSQANNVWYNRAFTTPYVAQPGVYYIGSLYNVDTATTPPLIAAGTPLQQAAMATPGGLTNSAMMCGILAGQADLPAGPFAISTLTQSATQRLFMLY